MWLELRETNYGLPIGETIEKTARPNGNFSSRATPYKYEAEYQFIDLGNKQIVLERGDIVRLGYKFPKDIRFQMAVVIDRIRTIKYKRNRTYTDTETVVMLLTGPKKGATYKADTFQQGCMSRHGR